MDKEKKKSAEKAPRKHLSGQLSSEMLPRAKPAARKAAPAKTKKPPTGTPKKDSKTKKTEGSKTEFRRVAMSKDAPREKDSITPPGTHLVDAFSRLKSTQAQRQTPAVTRLPAGGNSPAVRPKPAPISPETPATRAAVSPASPPVAHPPTSTPSARTGTPSPTPAKPLISRPAPVQPPTVKRTIAPPPSKPAPAKQERPVAPTSRTPHKQSPAYHPTTKPAALETASATIPAASSTSSSMPSPTLKPLKVTTQVTVRELAEKMEIKVNDFIKKLMSLGVFATINQRLESDTAILAAHEFGFDLEVAPMEMEEELAVQPGVTDKPEELKPRPAVITIMGHVDHGKTSLLDAIRSTRVAEKEAGGITQHIGAYKVQTPKGEITFLDTPGHEAFTAMRARGAKVTDIVILVVSAADGVMPQTVEAIDHAKAAGVNIIVAVNKIDLPTAQPQKIRQELSVYGLQPEEWGGKNIFVDVSAKKRLNLDKLLEMLLLQAEVMELKANPNRPGVGIIVEARLDPKKGSVATLLVQNGMVKVGQPFVSGLSYGKVKALVTDQGERILAAGPSTPVEILGISGELPQAGDVFSIVSSERQAREIAEKRRLIHREESFAHKKHMSLVGLKSEVAKGVKELRVILKADVQGSIQAIQDVLGKLSNAEIAVRMLHAGVGNLSESDVLLAGASDAVVLLFHVDVDPRAQELADRAGLEIRRYEIIYEMQADVQAAMEGLLEPESVETVVGRAEVRQIFAVKGGGKVGGCLVRDGKLVRGGTVRIIRGGQPLSETKVESLKRFKEDVAEVDKGLECGALLGYKDIQVGDLLELVIKEKRVRRLTPAK